MNVKPALQPRHSLARPTVVTSDPAPDPAALRVPLEQLVRRASYGPAWPAARPVESPATAEQWLRSQLSPESLPDPVADTVLARFPAARWSIAEARRAVETGRSTPDRITDDLGMATLSRAAWSRRQLLETVTEVWSVHFGIPNDGRTWDSRAHLDAVIRALAFGRFGDLLLAVTTHPATLRRLAGAGAGAGARAGGVAEAGARARSGAAAPNEHHGRELLDRHTVGTAAQVTEAEVADSSRLLSGLSVDPRNGEFVFRPDRHVTGPVSVQGFEHRNADPDAGYQVLVGYLESLARHPATAHRIARQLAVRFVSDDPTGTLVDQLVEVYQDADTAIAPVLRALFGSEEFARSAGEKVRRPFEDLVAAVRVLGIGPDRKGTAGIAAWYWQLAGLGQAPLATPDRAWSLRGADWAGTATVIARWNAHLGLAGGWWPAGLDHPGWRALLPADLPGDYRAVAGALAERVWPRPASEVELDAVCAAVGRRPDEAARPGDLPGEVPQLVALLLDSPAHGLC